MNRYYRYFHDHKGKLILTVWYVQIETDHYVWLHNSPLEIYSHLTNKQKRKYFSLKKVRKNACKSFAYPSKEQALQDFIRRKKWEIHFLKQRLNNVSKALENAANES